MSKDKDFSSDPSFRAFFAARWSRFLRENYRSPEAVSVAFSVRFATAANWWNGDHAPSGAFVAMAYGTHPEAARKTLNGGAAHDPAATRRESRPVDRNLPRIRRKRAV